MPTCALRVTASHRATGFPFTSVCAGPAFHDGNAVLGERTDRAPPFLARHHHRRHRRGSDPVRLRVPRRQRRRRRRWRWQADCRHRPRRPADRRPVRTRPGHQELRRAGRQDGQQEQRSRRRHLQAPGPGRRRPGRHRPAERHQVHRRRQGPRRGRPAQLRRRPVHAEGLRRRRHGAGLPGQHQPRADPGQGLAVRQEGAAVRHVLPHLHHRRHPGPVRGEVHVRGRGTQVRLRHRRQEDLRRGPRRNLLHGVQEARRQGGRLRPHQPRGPRLLLRRQQGRQVQGRLRLLRRRVPGRRPLASQIKNAGAKIPTVGGDALFSGEYIKLAKKNAEGDFASSVGAPSTPSTPPRSS